MIRLWEIRQTVIDWIEDDSTETVAVIDRTINTQLRYLCRGDFFEGLIRSSDVTPDVTGKIVSPPISDAILGIYNQTGIDELPSIRFEPIASRDISTRPRTARHKFRPLGGTTVPVYTGLSLSGAVGATTLTDAGGSQATVADMDGRELRMTGDPTRYLITGVVAGASIDIWPSLRVDATVAVAAQVDPAGAKQYVLLDPSANPYTDTVTVDYKVMHPQLIDGDDELLIPLERTLSLMVVQQFLQQSKYDVDAQRLENAIFDARHIEYGNEPTAIQDSAPQNTMFALRSMRGNGRSGLRRRQ